MKNFSKMVGISTICALFFLGFATKAATGDISGTGTTIPYTGLLLTYLHAQESTLSSSLTASYTKAYTAFAKTGLNILKSIDYQSLVCLGAITDGSLLSQLQKEKTALTISFKKDFIELENQILALEEKKALQDSDNVNVFDSGTTYESEKASLKDMIDAKVKLHKGFITSFEKDYLAKNTQFLTAFQQYSAANKDLIKGIQDKMAKVQKVILAFSGVEALVNKINAKVTGLDDVMQKLEDTKIKGLTNLDKTMQSLIDTNIKKYKKLQNISDELTKQKMYVAGQFQMDFDEYLTNTFQNRYNRSQYLALKEEVKTYRSKYYTITDQLNCPSIFAPIDEGTGLLTKIATMTIAVNSGWVKIEREGISSAFKDQLINGFQSLYLQKFKQRYAEYQTYLKSYIASALRKLTQSLVPTPSTGSVAPVVEKVTYVFTKPFKSGEYNEGIKALQKVLTNIGLYTGTVDGVYTPATKNAVYQFQLSKGLLKGYEKKTDVRGWMGPATRAALNKLTK